MNSWIAHSPKQNISSVRSFSCTQLWTPHTKAFTLITLEQEAEHVEEEENASAVQVREESFIIHDGELVSCDIADYVRYANDDQQQRIH